jgi:hypothetical protein
MKVQINTTQKKKKKQTNNQQKSYKDPMQRKLMAMK